MTNPLKAEVLPELIPVHPTRGSSSDPVCDHTRSTLGSSLVASDPAEYLSPSRHCPPRSSTAVHGAEGNVIESPPRPILELCEVSESALSSQSISTISQNLLGIRDERFDAGNKNSFLTDVGGNGGDVESDSDEDEVAWCVEPVRDSMSDHATPIDCVEGDFLAHPPNNGHGARCNGSRGGTGDSSRRSLRAEKEVKTKANTKTQTVLLSPCPYDSFDMIFCANYGPDGGSR